MTFSLLILAAHLAVSMWVFYDSQKHGYTVLQGLLWAIGVFLALIVFLPIYLFFRRRRGKLVPVPGRAAAPAQTTPCFYCGVPYPGDPSLCPNCGQNLKI